MCARCGTEGLSRQHAEHHYLHALLSLLWLANAFRLDNDAQATLRGAAVLAVNVALGALQGCLPPGRRLLQPRRRSLTRRCKGAPPACISVHTPCSAGPAQKQPRARCNSRRCSTTA